MRIGLVTILLASASGAAFAADIEAPSRIEAVTVHPDGAAVTRKAAIELPAGPSVVILRGLSPTIDPASIRVEGEADAPLVIGSVETRIAPGEARAAADERRLDDLRAERDRIAGQIEAAEGKRRAIEVYAKASPEKLSAEAKPLDVERWSAAWDAVGDGLARVIEQIRTLRASQRALEAEISALERGRPQPGPPGAPRRDVAIALEAGAPLKGALTIAYRVAGASWKPSYDVRLDTGGRDRKPSLEMVRRAQVTQRTGESWTDVALTVSTVRAARGVAAPDLPPLVVNLFDPTVVPEAARSARGKAASDAAQRLEAPAPSPRAMAAAPAAVPAVEQMAELDAGEFQSAFRVAGPVSVSADGAPRSVALGARRAEPTVTVKATPALDQTAYLEASFANAEDAPVLPGDAALHRDGVYVGRGRLGLVAPGDRIELGFGADDRVKIVRAPVKRKENEPGWIGNQKTEQREFKTSIRNLHDAPVRISVLDRMPISENSAVTIEALPGTPPTEKIVADKRGVMSWTWDYQPGEQKEIRMGYRMKWPADRDIVMDGIPLR
ncbi:mucoidy inhibitor MuiA family protein [Alsobacter sp. KACC 23698]|uniref:Mucoidy inhibitor MuiA family protein n=1 Tax=Alsobacter sp. KACC 23698 TaxID=3149229 RepID=A0AAU7JCW6_9HYPH